MSNFEFISSITFENYAKRIEKKNLKENGESLTFTGIARKANNFIIEIIDNDYKIKIGWREAMKA